MEITITAAARKHKVKKPALLWQVQNHPERFNARHIDDVNRYGLWLIDDECEGFTSWLASYRQESKKPVTSKVQQYHQDYYERVVKPKRHAERAERKASKQ